ncbi:SRPBCC family protein [Roseovarius sp. SCSIO 43702]|uniref:SRPBCC family protein n=1 Tax=Roseovarius sp. SCSIO 43702 TaxID=2823043 RepID=UPI001C73D421|nr:SRPBCC family protein [Roseovarius sp. SCSIO 43702]QYX56402.1 SRPBCC family protein [Roseovarius sp. SCSIO 43702]
MKFSSKDDIEAPIEFVFAQVSDFAGLERSALRRGAEVQRVDTRSSIDVGMTWKASFQFRGKTRRTTIELVEYDPPTAMAFVSQSKALEGRLDVELVALSRTRTRLVLTIDLTPRNLSARLLVQSLKLARSSLLRKFDKRLGGYARDIEERYHRVA